MSEEFRILSGGKGEVQKILNQWGHQYELYIVNFSVTHHTNQNDPKFHVLLFREPKED